MNEILLNFNSIFIAQCLESWTISLDHDGPWKPQQDKKMANLTKKFAFVEKSEGITVFRKVNYMLLIIIHYSNKLCKTFISRWYQNIRFKISGYLFTKKIPHS